ncbi:MAG: hypothetical protein SH868_13580 [Bythopirellula sp.]|nr:hypothetical protein [Bythopirellula sp.]
MSAALVASFALKLSFVAVMGIVCGWQPMPDGSPSYECVVQLEPELVNSLKRGESIPLSVEVPEHIRPISRIRITVGNGSVPQQTLVTNFKPWPADEKQPREGVVETQYTTNNGYQQPANGQILPVNEAISNTQDAFARSLQNGGQAVRDTINEATQDILPPDAGQSISNAVDRAGQQLGNNLKNVGDSATADIRQLFGTEPVAGSAGQIMPPGSANTQNYDNRQPQQQIPPIDSGTATNSRRRLDQPISSSPTNSSPVGNWQSSVPGVANQPKAAGNTANPNLQNGNRYSAAPSFTQSNGSILPQNNTPPGSAPQNNQVDRYGNVLQPQILGVATADSRSVPGTVEPRANSGPSFPPFTPTTGNQQSPITPTPTQASSTPEIRRDMLNQPANAAIQGANGLPIGQQPVASPQTVSTQPAPTSFNWDTKPQPQQPAAQTPATPTGPVFPLLLSWVLLSGSGAGNLYLFWSYLDVRNKYRDLVDEAARRISGRRVRD